MVLEYSISGGANEMKKIILFCFVLILGFFLISCDDDATGPKPQDTPSIFTPTPVPTATEIPATPTPTPTTPSYEGEWSGWIETNIPYYDTECFDGTIWFRVIDDTFVKGDATVCKIDQGDRYSVAKNFEFEGQITDGKFEYTYHQGNSWRSIGVKISGSFDSYRTCNGSWYHHSSYWQGDAHEEGYGQWHAEKIGE